MADVAVTTTGGVEASLAVAASGVLWGMASNWQPPKVSGLAQRDVDFVDWPVTQSSPSTNNHKLRTRAETPRIAVAPDVQPGERSLSAAVRIGDQLLDYADTVVVVPRGNDITPADVPDRFRIGVPTQTQWGTTPYRPDQYARAGNELHILGGGPATQLDRRGALGGSIASVDTSSLISPLAQDGIVWTGDGTASVEELGFSVGDSFAALVVTSCRLYAQSWGMFRVTDADTDAQRVADAFPGIAEAVAILDTVFDNVRYDVDLGPLGGVMFDGTIPATSRPGETDRPLGAQELADVLDWLRPVVESTRGGTLVQFTDAVDPDLVQLQRGSVDSTLPPGALGL